MSRFQVSPAARIAAFYCFAAVGWIVGSDWLADHLFGGDLKRLSGMQTAKGLVFVFGMTGMLYVLVRRMHRVEQRNRQVEAMLRVSERLETVGSLAATLVHDLNNMLAVIRGFTDLAKLEHGEEGLVRPDRLADIEGAVVRANAMVAQLSMFLQRTPGEVQWLQLGEVVRQLEPLLQQAASRRVDLHLQIAPGLPCVRIDRSQFEQALLNLVVNARDAMEHLARSELRITIEACRLQRHTSRQQPTPVSGNYVRIRVADTGCGIPEEQQVRVFEPFFTTKPAGCGTGLGLPSVLRAAQQHGGWVELESAVGKGAQFDLYLPVADAPPPVLR